MEAHSPGTRARATAPWVVAATLLAAGCLEYSPHALPLGASERDVHAASKARLEEAPRPSPLRFAVVGDTQLRFDDARDAVEALNRVPDLAFVVQIGDFTELGLLDEFREMLETFRHLSVPFFVTIGNHDQLGNGRAIFERMFGPVNDEFTAGGARFLLVDTNSREAGFDGSVPDLAWIGARLLPEGEGEDDERRPPVVVFSHVPPDSEEFDAALREAWWDLLRAGGVRATFHGHEHAFRSGVRSGIPFFVSGDVGDRDLLVATQREDGGFDVERVPF